MAKLLIKCESCGAEREVDERLAGSVLICTGCESQLRVPIPDVAPGVAISGFVLEKPLGAGAMGEVWLARQTAMDRLVALKLLSREFTLDSSFVERFLKEVRISAKMDHPNIITAFDAGCHGDIYYLAMSYVDGWTLDELLDDSGRLSEGDALKIVLDVAKALRYAWDEFGIIHRDIKPSNIMLDSKGVAKLMDMGISKSTREETSLTMTGAIIGTPYYMSPEQGMGEKELDFRSDIYSLGATLYHLVTGTVPFDATTALGIVSKHITEPVPSPMERNSELSESCALLLETMMAKSREDRQGSWSDVISDIERVLGGVPPKIQCRLGPGESVVSQTSASATLDTSEGDVTRIVPELASGGRKGGKKLVLAIVSAVVLVVLGALSVVFVSRGGKKHGVGASAPDVASASTADSSGNAKSAAPDNAALSADSSKPSESPALSKAEMEERSHAEMWRFAEEFAQDNKGNYDLIISNFEKIKTSLKGTKYELMANVEINKLQKERDEKLAEVLDGLRRDAEKLAAGKDFQGAAALLREYSGPFAEETGKERVAMAKRWEDAAKSAESETRRRIETQRHALEAFDRKVATLIVEKKFKEALSALKSPLAESSAAAKELKNVAEELAAIGPEIVRSFENEVGKTVAVDTVEGRKVLKISRVKNKSVYYAERKKGVSVQKKLDLKTLSSSEKVRRGKLGVLSAKVLTIVEAITTRKDMASAAQEFKSLPPTPGGEVFRDVFRSLAAERWTVELLRKWQVEGASSLDPSAVSKRLDSSKLGLLQRRKLAHALRGFKSRFGSTWFAKEHSELFKVLEAAAKSGVGSAGGGVSDMGGSGRSSVSDSAKPLPVVSNIGNPEAIKKALRKINPEYAGGGRFICRDGKCLSAELSGARGIDNRSLELLAGLGLFRLNVAKTGVTDLSLVRKMTKLRSLDISECRVEDISPLKGMLLRELIMNRCPVKDYNVLSTLKELRRLEPAELWRHIPGKEGTRNPPPRRLRGDGPIRKEKR